MQSKHIYLLKREFFFKTFFKTDLLSDFDLDTILECHSENLILTPPLYQSNNFQQTLFLNSNQQLLNHQSNLNNNQMILDNNTTKTTTHIDEDKKLSREISTFLALNLINNNNNNNNSSNNSNNNSNQTSPQKLEFESTIDLSDILIQEQYSYKSNTNMSMTELNTLPKKMSQAKLVSNLTKLHYLNNESNDVDDEIDDSNDYYDEESTCDTSTNDYDSESKNVGQKRKLTQKIDKSSKRSSTNSQDSDDLKPSGRGRGRGKGGRTGIRVKDMLNKEEAAALSDDGVARFGNKYVVKHTDEYKERRNKNNDAVKRCRAKIQEKQKERETRLKELSDENRKLSNQVDSLTKELNVLKGILGNMNPHFRLPNELEEKIKRLENMIIANQSNAK